MEPELGREFLDGLELKGVSRRSFLKFCAQAAALLGLSQAAVPRIAEAVERMSRRPPLVWLDFMECLGCTESFINATYPEVDRIILEILSLEYHEAVNAAAGEKAHENLWKAVDAGGFLCVVEGAVATGIPSAMTIGGLTSMEIMERVGRRADAVVAVGMCATHGGTQGASPNPTGAVGVGEFLKSRSIATPVINLPGCPVNPENIISTVLRYLLLGALPELDAYGRPLDLYGRTIHDNCPRRGHFDEGRFVERFGTVEEARGYCLYKVGCRGPETFSNCPQVLWNNRQNWCIGAGAPCIGCFEPRFWDRFADFYEPLPGVEVAGVRTTADRAGIALAAAAAAGVGAHLAASAAKGRLGRKESRVVREEEEGGE
ncbi:MAG TPA: twin-arginine translocation signal domain-containing protein [Deltaproteobacteria bacterium]|nr:twin-arginine translocation signal domain-containing protein [Deltaproteobacteria bacterium]